MSSTVKVKPILPKGTRDFLPAETEKRRYLLEVISDVFRKYGFRAIETPAMERLETLSGKYGEEGDRLLFKILNSGDFLKSAEVHDLQHKDSRKVLPAIAEKGLRYDLTVPLARYVVQHQAQLEFPFRRFHIGPVWRADRPQKGRYQEFYQCDADVVGSTALWNEVELLLIYHEAFQKLGLSPADASKAVQVRINSRKIIQGLSVVLNEPEQFGSIVTLLDKLDKVSWEVIETDLLGLGLSAEKVHLIRRFCHLGKPETPEVLSELNVFFQGVDLAREGIRDLEFISGQFFKAGGKHLFIDPSLMRGLDYYTGMIVEAGNPALFSGSLGGGGRYDNLTALFGGNHLSGVGISFGVERIYDLMEEQQLFPADISGRVRVLFVPREAEAETFCFDQVQYLRNAGLAAEMYLGNAKKQKHFDYADAKQIPFLVEVGEEEQHSGLYRLRDCRSRTTRQGVSLQDLANLIS